MESKQLNRRSFLSKSTLAGASFCLGCAQYFTPETKRELQEKKPFRERISQNAGMSYEQVFTMAYRDMILPQLNELANDIGREKLVELLKKATDKTYSDPGFMGRLNSNVPEQFWGSVLDLEVVDQTADSYTYKITNCLWAKIFREANAPDLGYAMACYGDYAMARTKNERLERNKTLMQGHDCCMMKWIKLT